MNKTCRLLAVIWLSLFVGVGRSEDTQGGHGSGVRNSLGMLFLKVRGTLVLFSMWETRVSDWQAYMADTHQTWPHAPAFPQPGAHPVVNVTLSEAVAFTEWLTQKERKEGRITNQQTYRLPTNIEWDAAVGRVAGETNNFPRFPWGEAWPPPRQAGNYNSRRIEGGRDDGYEYTAPVGQFRPSPDGLFDLGGNAWEWACDSGTPSQTTSATLRGGSWLYWRKECLESAYRFNVKADLRLTTVGFRCVLEDTAQIDAARSRSKVVEQEKRSHLLDRPSATAEEIREAQKRLALTPAMPAPSSSVTKGEAGKDQPSQGHSFINSLVYRLLPIPGKPSVLLGESEVRERDYRMFTIAMSDQPNTSRHFSGEGDHPISDISWDEAVTFCEWLTLKERVEHLLSDGAKYRLPTLAEWRVAAADGIAPHESEFPWGATWPPLPRLGNLGVSQQAGDVRGHVTDVKLLGPTKAGFYDLVGNVAEWCADIPAGKDGVRWYCGGSWKTTDAAELRGGSGIEAPAHERLPTVGFRLVLEMPADAHPEPTHNAP